MDQKQIIEAELKLLKDMKFGNVDMMRYNHAERARSMEYAKLINPKLRAPQDPGAQLIRRRPRSAPSRVSPRPRGFDPEVGHRQQQYHEIGVSPKMDYTFAMKYAPHMLGGLVGASAMYFAPRAKQLAPPNKYNVSKPTKAPIVQRTAPFRKKAFKIANATYHNPYARQLARNYARARYPKAYNIYNQYNAIRNPQVKTRKRKKYKKRKY